MSLQVLKAAGASSSRALDDDFDKLDFDGQIGLKKKSAASDSPLAWQKL